MLRLVLASLLLAVYVRMSLANPIHICKQPIGPKLCRYLCLHLRQCSYMDYKPETLHCHVTTDTSFGETDQDLEPVNAKPLVPVEPLLAPCLPHSRVISTRKRNTVCLANAEVHITKFKLEEKRKSYYLGDFEINVIQRTHMRMRIRAAGAMRIALLHGIDDASTAKYDVAISLGQPYKAYMYECGQGCVRVQEVEVQHMLWRGPCGGFADLWLQWSRVGRVSFGKGWILGANILMTYKRDVNLTFHDISLVSGTTRTVYVEVLQENDQDVNDICGENRSNNSVLETRIPLTAHNDVLNLNDYGIRVIDRRSLILKLDNPGKFVMLFSDKYRFSEKIQRMITYSLKSDGSYTVWVTYCIDENWKQMDPKCDIDFKPLEVDSVDEPSKLLTIWLQWKAGDYLALGTGEIPGKNELIAHRDVDDAPPINYILLSLVDGDVININVSGCT